MNNKDTAFWLSWCIEEYAAEYQMPNTEAAALFDKTGTLLYLTQNADVLHTQGRDYILNSIKGYIQKSASHSYENRQI